MEVVTQKIDETICNTIKIARQYQLSSLQDINLRKALLQSIQSFDVLAQQQQILTQHIMYIQYALAAFIDEVILFPQKEQIEVDYTALQVEIFGDHIAGENYFSKLEYLLQKKEQYREVISYYYLFIKLGYCGKYIGQESLLTPILEQIEEDFRLNANDPLVIKNEITRSSEQTPLSPKSIGLHILTAFVIVFTAYLIGVVTIKQQEKHTLQVLREYDVSKI
jgi:type IV/VI secretion system ImpK/VasF family protein